jgi:hypothetical protein
MTLARALAKTCPSRISDRPVKTEAIQVGLMPGTNVHFSAVWHLRPIARMGGSRAAERGGEMSAVRR